MYMCENMYICMYITCIPGANGGQKSMLDPLEPEVQTVISCHVDAVN